MKSRSGKQLKSILIKLLFKMTMLILKRVKLMMHLLYVVQNDSTNDNVIMYVMMVMELINYVNHKCYDDHCC